MADMNKEYRLERMNNYAGTMVTERTYNLTIGLTLLWGVTICWSSCSTLQAHSAARSWYINPAVLP